MNPEIEQRLDEEARPESRGYIPERERKIVLTVSPCTPIIWSRADLEGVDVPPLASSIELFELANRRADERPE
jgi:hypothetical protein